MKIAFCVWLAGMLALAFTEPPDSRFWDLLWGFTVPFLAFFGIIWYKFLKDIPGPNSDSGHPPGPKSD